MRVVFMGSGAFGLPSAKALAAGHDIALVVSQPDRSAGRGRQMRATPVAEWALQEGLPLERTSDVNEPSMSGRIRGERPDALVVIAFGQKLSTELLEGVPAFNLHASLLPAYRGAAPINRAMIDGSMRTGVSVIALANRMDAGEVFAQAEIPIDPAETAGELHDRLAELGPDVLLGVLESLEAGTLQGAVQEESAATLAPKLSRAEATTSFDEPAALVRARIHGLTPWPGCDVQLGTQRLRLLRVREDPEGPCEGIPGTLLEDGSIACAQGVVHLLEVKPAGGRAMSFDAWLRGHGVRPGTRVEAIT